MSLDIVVWVISTSPPSGDVSTDANRDDWIWLNPETGELHKFNTQTGQFDIDIPVKSHSHEGLEHLLDIITLLNSGITGSKTVGGYKFTFNHGVLTGFEAV